MIATIVPTAACRSRPAFALLLSAHAIGGIARRSSSDMKAMTSWKGGASVA